VTTEESTATSAGGRRPAGRSRARARRPRRRGRLVLLVVVVLLVAGLVVLGLLARSLVSAKHEARAAQADLTAAKAALSAHHVPQARAYVRQARAHVDNAHSDADGVGGDVWSAVPVAGGAVADERHLIDALDETTSVAQLGVKIYPIVSGSSAKLVHGQRVNIPMLKTVAATTTTIGEHIDRAISDLDQVQGTTPIVGHTVADAKATALGYLAPLQVTYQKNAGIIESLPTLVGADRPMNYVLAMLNPAEMRYSGGATLSFTTMRFDKGVATFGTSQNVDDIVANGDRQVWTPVKGNIFHHNPALRVTAATYSPWWTVSGEELLRGYTKAFPGTRYDGVIGIDLQGLASLFQITGPINLPSFGQITASNLTQTLGGSYGNFDSVAQRHQLNAELVPAFRQKFFEGGKISDKVRSLGLSAQGRHFITYFRDRAIRRQFAAVGLSGDLSRTHYDYVGVFSQNLNGSKTDYWQHRALTSHVVLHANGSAQVHLHVAVTNGAPAYAGPGLDPKTGYDTRYLGARIGVFMPRKATFHQALVNGKAYGAVLHRPKVSTVLNRKYVEGTMMLNSGQTATMDVTYSAAQAADVQSSTAMTYHLDIDPQDLVNPETLRLTVRWPAGYHPVGALPAGWSQTPGGARYSGTVALRGSWAIPLSKG
jgi:hypothetical protein